MSEIMHAARSMGLIAVHIETFCPRCRMQFNRHLAGLPDVLFISAGLEIKRNDSYEPSPGQQRVIERLEHAGVPCAVVSPGSEAAALEFLKSIAGRP
jgi:beta-phosphoglucomutase-like phosphatase (HAD superfamily)